MEDRSRGTREGFESLDSCLTVEIRFFIECFVTVTVIWRRDGDFSLLSIRWYSVKLLSSARQKVIGKKVAANVWFVETFLPRLTLDKEFVECVVQAEALGKGAMTGSVYLRARSFLLL